MNMFSDCSGLCCVCACGGGCVAGHGDDYYSPASKEQIIERLDKHEYPASRAYMIDYLKTMFDFEYAEDSSMKHEMTAREFAIQFNRMCNAEADCGECPLGKAKDYTLCRDYQITHPIETVSIVEKWAAEHPEETLEQVADGIYYDPKHRIVADATTVVLDIQVTITGRKEYNSDELEIIGEGVAKDISNMQIVQNAQHVGTQQFITKSHEEEL